MHGGVNVNFSRHAETLLSMVNLLKNQPYVAKGKQMSPMSSEIEAMLKALGEQLSAAGAAPAELVVCGGSAMNFQGFVARPTKDVDVVALLEPGAPEKHFLLARPLPSQVIEARDRVACDFGVSPEWLNNGPTDLVTWGLPPGCEERLVGRSFGDRLTVYFLGRYDLICLKLYALADNMAARHMQDLQAMKPSSEELESAARWTMTHDDSVAFAQLLKKALRALGADDVANRLG